jgi:hypothetical protein
VRLLQPYTGGANYSKVRYPACDRLIPGKIPIKPSILFKNYVPDIISSTALLLNPFLLLPDFTANNKWQNADGLTMDKKRGYPVR